MDARFGTIGISALAALLIGVAPAAGQREIRGTVHAPPGKDVHGTIVVACHVRAGHCDDRSPQSKASQVTSRGASARYVIRNLAPGEYQVVALRDVNGNGEEDASDWAGHYAASDGRPASIRPPAQGIDVRLAIGGAVAATPPAPGRSAPRPAPPTHSPPTRGRPPAGQGLDGIYVAIRQDLDMSGGAPLFRAREDVKAFFPDGRALFVAPYEGLASPYDWGQCADGAICGAQEGRGRRIHVKWNNGFNQVFLRNPDGSIQEEQVWWEGHAPRTKERHNQVRYLRMEAADGLRLEGHYAVRDGGRELVSITFGRDGSFVERNLIEPTNLILPYGEQERRNARAAGNGSGSYSIRRNTLELRYGDGRVWRFLFFVPLGVRQGPQPERIAINRIELSRVR